MVLDDFHLETSANVWKDLETQIRAMFSKETRNGITFPYLHDGHVYIYKPVILSFTPELILCPAAKCKLLNLVVSIQKHKTKHLIFLAVINIPPPINENRTISQQYIMHQRDSINP